MLVRISLLCTLLLFATAAAGQQQPAPQPTRVVGDRVDVTPPKTPEQSIPHVWELSGFAGPSYFNWIPDVRHTKLVRGGVTGARLTYNPWNHWGIESGWTIYGVNNLAYRTFSGGQVALEPLLFLPLAQRHVHGEVSADFRIGEPFNEARQVILFYRA